MKTRILIAALVAAVSGGVIGAAIVLRGGEVAQAYRGSQPPARITLPDFTLPDHTGQRVVSSTELRGRVVLITFLDAQCNESCPIIASLVARTVDRLTSEERKQTSAVAISTDPGEDTPEAVRDFLSRNRAEGKLLYLVAPVQTLRPIWNAFQIASSFDTGEDTLHSAPLRIYDRDGVWVSTLHAGADLTSDNLVHDIRAALDNS